MKCSSLYIGKIACLFLIFLFIQTKSQAQQNDTEEEDEKEKIEALPNLPFPDSIFTFNTKNPIPKRAGLYSALLPGLGQTYNRQYWKVGVVGVAAGLVSGFLIFNKKKYNTYQQAYIGRIDNDPSTTDTFTNYQTSDLDLLRKTYRKYVEYTVIAGTVCYLVNILDAFTSAHLKSFDMSKNISMKASPFFDNRKQIGIKVLITKK